MKPETDTLPALRDQSPTPAQVEQAVALIRPDEEWDGVGDGDLTPTAGPQSIPMLGFNRKLGGGFTLDDGEIVDQLDLVLLAKQNTRAWFSKPFGAKDAPKTPDCWSPDSETPSEQSADRQAVKCADCPLSKWGSDGTPPACKESFSAWVFLPDPLGFGRFARIRFGGLAFAPFRDYWASFRLRLPKRPPIAYVTHVVLEQVDKPPNGTFLVPRFLRTRGLGRGEAQPLIDERNRRLDEFKALAAEDAVEHVADVETEGPFDQPKPTTVVGDDGIPF